MNILVTGAAGLIGSHLIDGLLERNHRVTGVDDFSLGRGENLRHLKSHPRFQLVELDVMDEARLGEVFARGAFGVVFHLVANSDIQAGARQIDLDLQKTFLTTFAVLRQMKVHGVKDLLFSSTSAVYGERDGALHEDSGPLFPISLYGAAKLSSEAFVSAFVANYDLRAWVFRFPNVVGERMTHGVLYDFLGRLEKDPRRLTILGDGRQFKPYLYVKDLVGAILFAWERSADPLNYFNVGVDDGVTVTRIAQIVTEEAGLRGVELSYTGGTRGWVGDVPRFQYDLEKIHRLGWKATRTSEEAVRLAVRAELARRRGASK
jgi:UDP-glucose 4-epimerase